MPKLSRRSLLRGFAAGGAATALSPLLPRFVGKAHAHAAGDPFPTIFINLRGGLDPVMHWDSRTGVINRNVQAADIRETASGIRWYEPVLSPLTAHMEDMTLVRNLQVSSAHPSGDGLLWWGEGDTGTAASSTPWANYLSSNLLTSKTVASPTLVTYFTADQAIRNYISHSNLSPNPAGAAQRVRNITDFANSMDVTGGLPAADRQARVYALSEAMDERHYSRMVQPKTMDDFLAGNVQASELLNQPPLSLWPPVQATQDAFNMSANDVTRTVGQGNQRFVAHVAMAFEAARLQTSHVVFLQTTEGSYDTHDEHDSRQRDRSNRYMPTIGRLLSALKATPSPVTEGVSMFETTHVVITSELSRAPSAQTGNRQDGTPFDGSGTPHNGWTQAALFGGNFKRGVNFGAWNNQLRGVPANFTTGALNEGEVPTMKNLHATVMAASGVDPAGWTSSPAIGAVLKG